MERTKLPEKTEQAIAALMEALDQDIITERIMFELKDLDPLAAHFAHVMVQRLQDLSEELMPMQNSLREALSDYHDWECANALDRYRAAAG
jgi:hypothetical protein